jgi:hypothetical protein
MVLYNLEQEPPQGSIQALPMEDLYLPEQVTTPREVEPTTLPLFLRIEEETTGKSTVLPLPVFCHRLPILMTALGFAYVRLTSYLEQMFGWALGLPTRHSTSTPTPWMELPAVPRFAYIIDAHTHKIIGVCVSLVVLF